MINKIAIVTPGYMPVPAVCGGAIEQLVTTLIKENEHSGKILIDVYTVSNPMLNDIQLTNTKIIQCDDKQKIFLYRLLFYIINKIYRMLRIKKRKDYISIKIAKKVVKKKETYDAIIVENNFELFFNIRRNIKNLPIIMHIHNDFDTISWDYDKTSIRVKKVANQANQIWACSRYLKNRIFSTAPFGEVKILENCIDKDHYKCDKKNDKLIILKEKYKIKEDEMVFLFCGRFSQEKGLYELLKSFGMLPKQLKIKLLIVGSTWFGSKKENEYEKKIQQMIVSLGERVVICGYVNQEEMPLLYQMVDIVTIPSQCNEAFGMVALEAISMGKPCIATACGGLVDILTEECAVLVNNDKNFCENFSNAIERLYMDKSCVKKMGKEAKKRAMNFMDGKAYYEHFLELLNKI